MTEALQLAVDNKQWNVVKIILSNMSPWDIRSASVNKDLYKKLKTAGIFEELRRMRNDPREIQTGNAWKSHLALAAVDYVTKEPGRKLELLYVPAKTINLPDFHVTEFKVSMTYIGPVSVAVEYWGDGDMKTLVDGRLLPAMRTRIRKIASETTRLQLHKFAIEIDIPDNIVAEIRKTAYIPEDRIFLRKNHSREATDRKNYINNQILAIAGILTGAKVSTPKGDLFGYTEVSVSILQLKFMFI